MPRITAGQHRYGQRKINRYTLVELQRIVFKQMGRISFLQDQMAEKAVALLSAEQDAGKAERECKKLRETVTSKEGSLRQALRDKDAAASDRDLLHTALKRSDDTVDTLHGQIRNLHNRCELFASHVTAAEADTLAERDRAGRLHRRYLALAIGLTVSLVVALLTR